MKATIERATLLRSLGHVQSVVERRNTIPILSNVLLEASEEGGIRLMATDLDLQINETVEANVTQPGATTVSAHTLFDIARKLPEGSQVELSAANGKMQVNAGRARFNLSTLPRDDFPVIAEGELPHSFELPAAILRQIIDKTRALIAGYGAKKLGGGCFSTILIFIVIWYVLGQCGGNNTNYNRSTTQASPIIHSTEIKNVSPN
jgi:DNA polymerase-3 subunit beta